MTTRTARDGGGRRGRRGAAAVEFAVIAPFVGLLFVIAVDFCRLYAISQTVQASAEAGVVYAAGYSSASQADAAAAAAAQGQGAVVTPDSVAARTAAAQAAAVAEGTSLNPPLQNANVSVTVAAGKATVTVSYTCTLLTPVPGVAGVQTLTRTVVMNRTR